MKVHIFKGEVHHNKHKFIKGQACPEELVQMMQGKGLVEPLPEAVKPIEPPKAAEAPAKK